MSNPKERIMAAAVQIFGRKGFKAATVREICHAARVNLAALNYYFGNKESLYRTLVTQLLERAIERYPADMGKHSATEPAERLRLFISAMLHRLLDPGGLSGFQNQGRLLARELADPSPVLDTLVQDHIRPQAAILEGIIAALIGPDASRDRVMRCTFSIMGQCFYYGYAWPIASRLYPPIYTKDPNDAGNIEILADHIANFSLQGLKRYGKAPSTGAIDA
jgi:TetR/AcrR family transcriptional regulator, regulator of cefoperazone and chloramphenicol sensitivity